ncbi:AAA domain-containing protein [Sporolactobacillus shoreicorticis]|uniref:AAA domain-containing protein n=1 Tax=Sporolactobacillus shoreicorticis TaxID=1923877 RepID=A0ABW5S135_9BACL|nr:AAA domain-containing protein [Sporolactobacillus shoreicorticis]MCO7124604.1 AAA domain-containing protein [Sporolactobacillus shoreicorticis]
MNRKEDILNAWIVVEQLSEGSINKRDKELNPLKTETNDWATFFLDFINTQKKQQKISEKAFKKSGLVLYFAIFNFQEIVDILRRKYNIPATYEETTKSDKFTFSLYFDNELNFLADKLFLTMSGYIRYKGRLPKDFLKVEDEFRNELSREFDEDFNKKISELFKKYKVSSENFRYSFVKNIDNGDVNLHSFFIDDLQKAKEMHHNKNLNRYFDGFSGRRQNLNGKKDSQNFNPQIFEEVLQPKLYPLGRFPSNPDHALSFMQQVAVNLALNEKNDIRSVNGPPGTGKTTLLKDIFADLVVQQAAEICKRSDKHIQGTLVYWKEAKLGILPHNISDNNIVVASSNNGAVQNIVKELPQKKEIAGEFQKKIAEIDYFQYISNLELSSEGFGKSREIKTKLLGEENWGTFSLEGGASINVNKLMLNVECIEKSFEENNQLDLNVYQEFSKLRDELNAEREKIQQYSEQIRRLLELKDQYEKQAINFKQGENRRQTELAVLREKITSDLNMLRQESDILQENLSDISIKLRELDHVQSQAERNFDVVKSQKPSLLWMQKIFNKSQVNQYLEKLNNANEMLNHLSEQRKNLLDKQVNLKNALRKHVSKSESNQQYLQNAETVFDQWTVKQQNILQDLKQKIVTLEKIKSKSDIKALDFSQSYDDLQKSNPWFTKTFRVLQSELFISALKVRKRFLFENKKNLKAARIIWNSQMKYMSKENGQQLVTESWQWLNFAIPVVSTTFASFGRMFKNLNENSIGNLFIDEAGQALPQASVGAIFRSKRVMVVGDPSQITPVLTIDSNVLNIIGRHYEVNEKFVSADASTQTLVDATSQYGFQRNEGEWIGIPLWVHRRSDYPMFTISNEISYDGLMVQGKPEEDAQGKSEWFHSTGKASDKFVKEQAELLKNLIDKRVQKNPELRDEIYVISPFRHVAYKLAQALDEIHFTKRKKGKLTNIGTVHTFQGKEAKIVYFVLGADTDSKGAAKWAVSDPNMMNVAATRAKEEFYVIGDKKLYASLGSKVANTTISIIDNYNKQAN